MSHIFPIRVYYEDTDAGGIVYHSNYLNFAERARTEMVREMGVSQSALLAEGRGTAFAVRHAEIDFRKPARLDDRLEVESEVTEVKGASLKVRQVIRRLDDGIELVRLNVRLAYISLDGRPVRLPAGYQDSLLKKLKERR
jgi:acyl-CoA thioester hydrolase